MYKRIELKTIKDIDELPSVLDIEDLSQYLIQLVDIIKSTNTDPVTGAELINNLISYQSYNEEGLSIKASLKILEYIKEIYKSNNRESIDCNTANLANLTCREAKEFIMKLLSQSTSSYEKQELTEALSEVAMKT